MSTRHKKSQEKQGEGGEDNLFVLAYKVLHDEYEVKVAFAFAAAVAFVWLSALTVRVSFARTTISATLSPNKSARPLLKEKIANKRKNGKSVPAACTTQ